MVLPHPPGSTLYKNQERQKAELHNEWYPQANNFMIRVERVICMKDITVGSLNVVLLDVDLL